MIKIFDTTLRDGEQSPGFSMKLHEKLLLAQQLEKLGVDVIEAGFPIASPDDFEAVKRIGELCQRVEVCALARCKEKDISRAIEALQNCKNPRLHVFIATSDIHLEHKLKITREEAVKNAIAAVEMAKQVTDKVDFSPEDAVRTDPEFLVEILNAVIKAGVDTVNIPDTVGYSTPEDFGNLIKYLRENVVGIEDVIISTHCHNDLGLAVANSLAGVRNGARQIECTVNGIGERAGNASLEEVVMAMKVRPDLFPEKTNIDATQLVPTSRLVTQITGHDVQPNKAIVGRNAFAHEAGIHQHGVLSNRLTYEIMRAEDVGHNASQLVLGKHSGRNAIVSRLQGLGIQVDKERLDSLFEKFKQLADRKKNVYDEDLIMLAMDYDLEDRYELMSARTLAEKGGEARAKVVVRIEDAVTEKEGKGDGPVSALYSAIISATKLGGKLLEFKINALTPEKDAVGVVHIKWEDEDGTHWHGQGSDTDVTIAAAQALIDVFNRRVIRQMHDKNVSRREFISALVRGETERFN